MISTTYEIPKKQNRRLLNRYIVRGNMIWAVRKQEKSICIKKHNYIKQANLLQKIIELNLRHLVDTILLNFKYNRNNIEFLHCDDVEDY
jgi:hypothetical protein